MRHTDQHTERDPAIQRADGLPRPAHAGASSLVRASADRASVLREGCIAGIVAATGVALWYLVGDLLVTDAPLVTQRVLGWGLASVLGLRVLTDSATALVLQYTVAHYGAFMALGVVAAVVVRRARRDATVLAGALLTFAVAEGAFYGLLALLNVTTYTGAMAWPQLVAGNVVGCLILGAWLWRSHPELRGEVAAALGGAG